MKTLLAAVAAAFITLLVPVSGASASDNGFSYGERQDHIINKHPGLHTRHHWQRKQGYGYVVPKHRRSGVTIELNFGNPGYHVRPRHGYVYHPRPVYRPAPVVRLTRSHVSWCYDRYRSYNHRTNTFISYGGQHRHCISPFSH
jgi:hypothetical protein